MWASVVVAHMLSSCGTQAQLLHSLWDLPGPGIEPMSPALVQLCDFCLVLFNIFYVGVFIVFSILPPSSVSIFMTIIFNSLSGKSPIAMQAL